MPDPTTTQTDTVQPGIVDTDILLLRPPFTLPHQVPMTAEADSLLAQMRILEESARRIAADRDSTQAYLLSALAGREQALADLGQLAGVALLEHAENVELHARLAELRHAGEVASAATVEFAKVPWPLEPADRTEPSLTAEPDRRPTSTRPPKHRGHRRFPGRTAKSQQADACPCLADPATTFTD